MTNMNIISLVYRVKVITTYIYFTVVLLRALVSEFTSSDVGEDFD